jgi:hypothetical protein
MSADILALYSEFTAALTEVLAENAVGPARRGRLVIGLLLRWPLAKTKSPSP